MNQSRLVPLQLYLLIAFVAFLSGCSAGKIEQSRLIPTENLEGVRIARNYSSTSSQCPPVTALAEDSTNRSNSIFVHPGLLLLGFNWDQSLAVEAGSILAAQNMTGKMIELRDRDPLQIYQHSVKDPGTDFIGIHYSMGGRPDILRGSLDAIKKASQERQIQLRYHAILFDPFGISNIGDHLDINEPELGYVFILLSSEYSFLRPGIHDIPKSFADSGKLFFVFAEDFDESWGHFGMLHAFREHYINDPHLPGGKKMRSLFNTMVAIALNDGYTRQDLSTSGCVESPNPGQLPQFVRLPIDSSRKP